jgi:hypothetical protein
MFAYGANWNVDDPLKIELALIAAGGTIRSNGVPIGKGLSVHYQKATALLWPKIKWHRWNELAFREIPAHQTAVMIGPASSGKTNAAALFALVDYYAAPDRTTWMVSSTTYDGLERRVWGEIKMLHRDASELRPWLPGHVIDSRRCISTDGKEVEGRDFRNGIVAVACLSGGNYVGLGNYVGVKNDRLRLLADELQFMPKAFVDSISNLSKNRDFRVIGLGNPKDRTDALGMLGEPEVGWDSIGNAEKTRTFPGRRPRSIVIQFVGTDSPNYDEPRNQFPFLIKPEDIEADAIFYGRDSLQFTMMNEGNMPRDAQARRVITRSMVMRGMAMEPPVWQSEDKLTKILALDAAYSGTGGDRCILMRLGFGPEVNGNHVVAILGIENVPVSPSSDEPAEYQIANHVRNTGEAHGIPASRLYFDSTGRGSLATALAAVWAPSINPVEFGGHATKRPLGKFPDCSKRFGKFVSELWFASAELIQSGQIRGLPEDVMMEGCMREFVINPSGLLDVEPKHKTKLRMGRSPDLYDAFVVGVEGARRLGFQVDRTAFSHKPETGKKSWVDKRQEAAKKLRESFNLAPA